MKWVNLKLITMWCGIICVHNDAAVVTIRDAVTVLLDGDGLSRPSDLAFENSASLWVTNFDTDSVTIISVGHDYRDQRQDCFAEHFMEYPLAIAFDTAGSGYFSTAHDSRNCVRNMTFIQNPERNYYFKCNHFVGPTLWHTSTFAIANQDKNYKGDWLAPGSNHDNFTHPIPPESTQNITQFCRSHKNENDCVKNVSCHWYWNPTEKTYLCNIFHTEGSHMDMLHESPFSVGIAHHNNNQYWVFDGHGHGLGTGHLVFYDYNQDHGPGSTYHSDGIVRRYLDVTLTRVAGVHSGMGLDWKKNWLYIADTGNNRVIRVNVNTGTTYQWLPSYYAWEDQLRGGGKGLGFPVRYDSNATGPEPGAKEIEVWVRDHLNKTNENIVQNIGNEKNFNGSFITPKETLIEYSAVLDAVQETLITDVTNPTGLAIVESGKSDVLYIAEQSGSIHLYEQDKTNLWTRSKTYQTSSTNLMGLAVSYNQTILYAADAANNRVLSITLTEKGSSVAPRQLPCLSLLFFIIFQCMYA